MKLSDLSPDQRPRERLFAHGPKLLSDAELLAVFLRTGIRGKDALSLAHELLADSSGLAGLLAASPTQLLGRTGLGTSKAAQLSACLELVRRSLDQQWRREPQLHSPSIAADYFRTLLSARSREVFACAFLDTRLRLIALEEMFHGTLDRAEVHPREVVKRALELNAAACMIAHNHPSGEAEPSRADLQLTQQLAEALRLVDIRLLDHVVVARDGHVSLAARGLI